MLRARALRALLLALLVAPGCAPIVQGRSYPALGAQGPLRHVAVAPFSAGGRLAAAAPGGVQPALAAALVARYVAEALAARGVEVVPADDVAHALGIEGEPPSAAELAQRTHAEFGVEAVLVGSASRFVERSGEAAGTLRPAGVGFDVTLYAAPGGEPLWTASFDETQHALSENVFTAFRYPGGGTRWLTADELARWGAGELTRAMPVGP